MPWIIVKFSRSEEIEAVPFSWYNESSGTLLYPPFPKNRMERAIKNETQPGDDWREYSVSLMREKKYDNFRMACGKASKCCITSEISETEISEKRAAKKKFSSSEEDSGSDLEIPRPQAIKKRTTHQLTTDRAMKQATDLAIETITDKTISEKNIDEVEKFAEVSHNELFLFDYLDDFYFLSFKMIQNSREHACINMMVKAIKLLRECDNKINELSDKLEGVSLLLKDKELPSEDDNSKDANYLDLFNDFPIKNETMLENVETKLANEKTYKNMVDNLCVIGGRDYKDCSRRFLQRIIDDGFAAEYSMQGHKKKKVFRSTRICACLLDAIQRCHKDKASLKDIEDAVSVYLAKSTERMKRKVINSAAEDTREIDVE